MEFESCATGQDSHYPGFGPAKSLGSLQPYMPYTYQRDNEPHCELTITLMEPLSDSSEQSVTTSAGSEAEELSIHEEPNKKSASPIHPISQLQGPFEESISEAAQGAEDEWVVDLDAQTRRKNLLQNPQYERLCGRKWRQRAGERYHPFWKLSAQMSFGVHLLVKRIAKSDAEVLRILQAHVDEMDGFISRTKEDFLIIQIDVRTRIQYLRLPLENLDVFDEMLEDRSFRLSMIGYNEKIEHAIARFTEAVSDSLKDIQKGKEAIGGLWQYLGQSSKESAPLSSSLAAVYNSMMANAEGWNTAFSNLRRKGLALQNALSQLGRAITEMQRRVGVASRKDVVLFIQTPREAPRSRSLKERVFERRSSVTEKPLPCDPTRAKTPEPRPKSAQARRLAQKSVPNLRAIREFDECNAEEKATNRAKSMNGASSDFDTKAIIPKIQRSFSRRLSIARLTTKKPAESLADETQSRPSTAASSRLKPFRRSRNLQQNQQQTTHPEPPPPLPPMPPMPQPKRSGTTTAASARRETMKNQLLQYFKSDRVIETWETVTEKGKLERHTSQRKKDGLWSKFHAKPSSPPSEELQANLSQDDLPKQMVWLEEEAKALNTYSLKPKQDTAPGLHTFSVQMSFHQELHEQGGPYTTTSLGYSKPLEADAQSIITALPVFPIPPITRHLPPPPEIPS
ncbi:hypothetical protein AOCH_007459 [Aspergillus ochraceoroseus]|uniref:Uncharacterized protein n=2 Tax=Aspergillus ochraceoroseus TaxID=138278 RepID=A0A0F8VMV5_9EURO|nr:hypothetical protein AOCH_007459 [Aspergillus ochraceoroseus]